MYGRRDRRDFNNFPSSWFSSPGKARPPPDVVYKRYFGVDINSDLDDDGGTITYTRRDDED